jgi:uncharacterized protein (TIGR02328 family)
MIMWTPAQLPNLPDKLLLALHRDICKVRSNAWHSPKGSHTWYYALPWEVVTWYHTSIMREMLHRQWKPSAIWFDPLYRGKRLPPAPKITDIGLSRKKCESIFYSTCPIKMDKYNRLLDKWISNHTK